MAVASVVRRCEAEPARCGSTLMCLPGAEGLRVLLFDGEYKWRGLGLGAASLTFFQGGGAQDGASIALLDPSLPA